MNSQKTFLRRLQPYKCYISHFHVHYQYLMTSNINGIQVISLNIFQNEAELYLELQTCVTPLR